MGADMKLVLLAVSCNLALVGAHRGDQAECAHAGSRSGLVYHSGVPRKQPEFCMPSPASPVELGVYTCLIEAIREVKQRDCSIRLEASGAGDDAFIPCNFFKIQGLLQDSRGALIRAQVDQEGLELYFVSKPESVSNMGLPSASVAAQEATNFAVAIFGGLEPFDDDSDSNDSPQGKEELGTVLESSNERRSRKLVMFSSETQTGAIFVEQTESDDNYNLLELEMDADYMLFDGEEEEVMLTDSVESKPGRKDHKRRHKKSSSHVIPPSYLRRHESSLAIVTPVGCKYKFKVDDPASDVLEPGPSSANKRRVAVMIGTFLGLAVAAVGFAMFISFSRKYSELLHDQQEYEFLRAEILKSSAMTKRLLPHEMPPGNMARVEESMQAGEEKQ